MILQIWPNLLRLCTHTALQSKHRGTITYITFYQAYVKYTFHLTAEPLIWYHGWDNIHSFIPLARAKWDDSLPFSGASSIPLCYLLLPATLLHQLFFHPLSPHLVIYFLVYFSILLFPNSYTTTFWEFHFLPFSVHAQTNAIYLTLLSLL